MGNLLRAAISTSLIGTGVGAASLANTASKAVKQGHLQKSVAMRNMQTPGQKMAARYSGPQHINQFRIQKTAALKQAVKRRLEKRAFGWLGSAIGQIPRVAGKMALGAGTAKATGGDAMSGAMAATFLPGAGGAAAGGTLAGVAKSTRRARNKKLGLPSEQEAATTGAINPGYYQGNMLSLG